MTQRTKYRTGRRSANRHADKSGKHVSAKSVSMQEETQPKELIMMNEKNESQELEQIETKKIENTSPAPEQVEGVEVVEVAEVKSTLDTSEEMLNERVEEVSQHEASTVASEDASTTTNVSEESVSAHSSRGGVGKMILGGVILASLAGGAYYYAQQNQLFGLGESSTTESTLTEAPQSSDTSVVNTAENTVATTDTNEKTEMSAETNSAETTSAESSSVADTLAKELSDNAKKTEETAKALADDLIGTGVTEEKVETSDTEEKVETSDTEEKTPESSSEAMTSEAIQQDSSSVVASSITENTTNSVSPESAESNPTESNSATQALETRLAAQEQQIAQLVAQLKEAQAVAAEQQAKEQKQQSLRHVLNELSSLYQAADFERTVRVNKENAVKALGILKNQLALQTDEVWNGVRQAVDSDIEALNNAGDINLDKLFAASNELAELVKSAPFVSAESGNDTVATTANTVTDTTSNTGGSWLDQAINHVERLPAQAYEAIRSDLGGLVKVEKLSNPAVAMMSISDIQAQRAETLRQLSIAQEALLKRQEPVWKAAMQKVEQQLMTYYNLNIEKTQQAVALARQLMNTSVQSSLPALSNTQQALEQFARQLRIEN